MIHPDHRPSRRGSALVIALLMAVILTAIAGTGYRLLQQQYRLVHQTGSWEEALLASEAGIDLAVGEMRKSLIDPALAWTDWHTDENDASSTTGANPKAGTVYYTSTVLLRSGEGGQRSWAQIAVDAPAGLIDSSGEQWYRVRSLGVSEVPGGSVAVGDSVDTSLRKLDLVTNRRTGNRVLTPQATRLIEAIVKPVGTFRLALMGVQTIDLNNYNIVIDSYDSRDDTRSTNGRYDVTKRQSGGNIATNGILINAGDAHIYGSASTNGGTVLGSSNVTGEIRSDFYQEILPVERPNAMPDAGTPTLVTGDTTILANAGDPTQVLLSRISLSGPDVLHIQGAADGSETFCQIVVTGDVSLSGQSQIILDPGVYVRIFVVGDTDIGGQGVANPGTPTNFQFYGVDRPPKADGSPATPGVITIAGNGGFTGSVYAPNYDLEMVGGGNADTIFGAFLAHTCRMTGVQSVHYDEALADGGLISDYKVVSWFEDVR